ncbi:MAG: alpha-amylase family glycosyl hydrolase, partial [Candidatus Hodarchaeales archaeon]
MGIHKQLFEINSRAWLYSLREKYNEDISLITIPDEIWIKIIEKGFDWIWLMGVWKHSSLSQEELAKHPGLIKEITHSLPNWTSTDVIGSPYSIVDYELNPELGQVEDLLLLKRKLNDLGAKLMLDFVPNHFGSASKLVLTNPDYFISMNDVPKDKSLFKHINTKKGLQWIAYGKDPYFPPWTDTFQLNYYNKDTRKYMTDILINQIAEVSDGVRCDMAMLCLNDILNKTWGSFFQEQEIDNLKSEFWTDAIKTLKKNFPEFIFLAEVY